MSRALILLLLVLVGAAAWLVLGQGLFDDEPSTVAPGVDNGSRRPDATPGRPLREESAPGAASGGDRPAPPRVAVWRPDETWDGVDRNRDADGVMLDLPDPRVPRWGERLLDEIGRHLFVRFRTQAEYDAVRRLEPGELADRDRVGFAELMVIFQPLELDMISLEGVVYIRRLPGEDEEPEEWPPPR